MMNMMPIALVPMMIAMMMMIAVMLMMIAHIPMMNMTMMSIQQAEFLHSSFTGVVSLMMFHLCCSTSAVSSVIGKCQIWMSMRKHALLNRNQL